MESVEDIPFDNCITLRQNTHHLIIKQRGTDK